MKAQPSSVQDSFSKKVFITLSMVTGFVIFAYAFSYATEVFLMLFGGILFALFLRGTGIWIHDRSRLPLKAAILIVLFLIILAAIALCGLFFPVITSQISQFAESLPQSIQKVTHAVENTTWLKALTSLFGTGLWPSGEVLIGKSAPLLSSVLGGMVNAMIMFIMGLYLALNSEIYLEGFLNIIPRHKKARVRQFFLETGAKLQHWLSGQFISMFFIGLLTTVGLMLLKVPMALMLGVLAGMLNFIPTFGLIMAIIPAVLLAFGQSPDLAVAVAIFYLALNAFEAYFLCPWIQYHNVALPPVLIIFPQILLGILFGFMGLVLATPLTLVLIMAVKFFYIEDVLERRA